MKHCRNVGSKNNYVHLIILVSIVLVLVIVGGGVVEGKRGVNIILGNSEKDVEQTNANILLGDLLEIALDADLLRRSDLLKRLNKEGHDKVKIRDTLLKNKIFIIDDKGNKQFIELQYRDDKLTTAVYNIKDVHKELSLSSELSYTEDGFMLQVDRDKSGFTGYAVYSPYNIYLPYIYPPYIYPPYKIAPAIGCLLDDIKYEQGEVFAKFKGGGMLRFEDESGKRAFFVQEADGGYVDTAQVIIAGDGAAFRIENKVLMDAGKPTKITVYTTSGVIQSYEGRLVADEIFDKDGKTIAEIKTDANLFEEQNLVGIVEFDGKGEKERILLPGGVVGEYEGDNTYYYGPGGWPFLGMENDDGKSLKVDPVLGFVCYSNGEKIKECDPQLEVESKKRYATSQIGPAFWEAGRAARAGTELSTLLFGNSDFVMNWRRRVDNLFEKNILGKVVSGDWDKHICNAFGVGLGLGVKHGVIAADQGIVEIMAHVEGERSTKIKVNGSEKYYYKISFGISTKSSPVTMKVLVDGTPVDINGDGKVDKLKLDKAIAGFGEGAIVRLKDQVYKGVCLEFDNVHLLPYEFANKLNNGRLCNDFVEVNAEYVKRLDQRSVVTGVEEDKTSDSGGGEETDVW